MAARVFPFSRWVGIERAHRLGLLPILYEGARANGWDPDDLAGHIAIESEFDPEARNKASNAFGLIQWTGAAGSRARTRTAKEQAADAIEWFRRRGGKALQSLSAFRIAGWGGADPAGPDSVVILKGDACKKNPGKCDPDQVMRNGTVRRLTKLETKKKLRPGRYEGFSVMADEERIIDDPYNDPTPAPETARRYFWATFDAGSSSLDTLEKLEQTSGGAVQIERRTMFDRGDRFWVLASLAPTATTATEAIFASLAPDGWNQTGAAATARTTATDEVQEADKPRLSEQISDFGDDLALGARRVLRPLQSPWVWIAGIGAAGVLIWVLKKASK